MSNINRLIIGVKFFFFTFNGLYFSQYLQGTVYTEPSHEANGILSNIAKIVFLHEQDWNLVSNKCSRWAIRFIYLILFNRYGHQAWDIFYIVGLGLTDVSKVCATGTTDKVLYQATLKILEYVDVVKVVQGTNVYRLLPMMSEVEWAKLSKLLLLKCGEDVVGLIKRVHIWKLVTKISF